MNDPAMIALGRGLTPEEEEALDGHHAALTAAAEARGLPAGQVHAIARYLLPIGGLPDAHPTVRTLLDRSVDDEFRSADPYARAAIVAERLFRMGEAIPAEFRHPSETRPLARRTTATKMLCIEGADGEVRLEVPDCPWTLWRAEASGRLDGAEGLRGHALGHEEAGRHDVAAHWHGQADLMLDGTELSEGKALLAERVERCRRDGETGLADRGQAVLDGLPDHRAEAVRVLLGDEVAGLFADAKAKAVAPHAGAAVTLKVHPESAAKAMHESGRVYVVTTHEEFPADPPGGA